MTFTLLQALRALLCLGVMLMHIKIYLTRYGDPSFFAYLPDILGGIPSAFFALSGYFMAMLVDRESPNFLPQRLIRIYPTYFLVVALSFGLRGVTAMPLHFDDMFKVLTLLPFGMGPSYKLGIEWTLVYEIWYYFICAFFCRPGWSRRFPAFLVAWLFVGIFKDIYFFAPPVPVPNVFTVWVSIWGYSFILGALTYYFLQRIHEVQTWFWAGQIALATGVVTSALYMKAYFVLYVLGVLSCLLLVGLMRLEKRMRAPKLLALAGDYSYALYLVHSNVILMVLDRYQAITGQPPGAVAGLMAATLCCAGWWYIGQIDVAMHKRLKGTVNRLFSAETLARLTRLVPFLPAKALGVERKDP